MIKTEIKVDVENAKKAFDEVSLARVYNMALHSLDPENFNSFEGVFKILCDIRRLDIESISGS